MRIYIITVTLLFAITFSSCEKSTVDTTPPSMEVVEFIPVPSEDTICGIIDPYVFHLEGGDQLSFDVIFEDNEGLSQFKVDIHNNFDCHGHGGGSAPSIAPPSTVNQTIDWAVLEVQDLSGTNVPLVHELVVPENVTAGNYHFQIQVLDESGNDRPLANFYALKITNPLDQIAPHIQSLEPLSKNFAIKKGEKITFSGRVTDNRSLSDGGNGVLYLSYTDLSSGNTFSTDQVFVFDENTETTYDYNFEYTIPTTLVSGSYQFSLGANDGVRNVAPFEFFEVEITD